MARVSSHPTIVNLHGVGALDDGREFLIMEYCPVTNIADQVRAHPMDVPAALDLIIRISSGVEMLHRMGYVHRDIKPGNIMLDSYQSPVLTDFGVSARIGEGRDGGLEGFSVMWAPPEQHDGSGPRCGPCSWGAAPSKTRSGITRRSRSRCACVPGACAPSGAPTPPRNWTWYFGLR